MRRTSVARPMLLAVFLMTCTCVLVYELIDLLHANKYACPGHHYLTLPDLNAGTCRRVWEDWTFMPTGPRALWDGFVILCIAGLFASLSGNVQAGRRSSPPLAVLLDVFFVACVGLVAYEVVDLLHVSKYACDGVNYGFFNLPNLDGGTCHRVWDDWVFRPKGPLTPWEFLLISGMVGLLSVAIVIILASGWRQKQIDWLLEAVVDQTERLVLRTQFEFATAAIQASKDALHELGSQLLLALTEARRSVAFEGNTAESAAKLAMVHHEFALERRESFIMSRVNARRVVAATLAVLNGSFSEAWHEVVYAWHAYLNTKEFVPEMVLLAKLTGLPSNPHSDTFKAELDAAIEKEKWGFSLGTYLSILLPLRLALSRHDWMNEVQITVQVKVTDPRRSGKTTTDSVLLKGEPALRIMKAFLAQPLSDTGNVPTSAGNMPKSA